MTRRIARTSFPVQMFSLACVVLCVTPLHAQILHATGPLPSFDAATIKPSTDGKAIPSISSLTESRTMNVTARNLIEQAYQIPWTPGVNERVVGGPAWMDTNHYDVEARIDESQLAALSAMSNQQRKEQTSLRLQALLADRLKLRVHFDSRELPIYALAVAKGGPKLVPAKATPAEDDTPPPQAVVPPSAEGLRKGIFVQYRDQQAEMTAKGVTLAQLVQWLAGYSEIGGRTVFDQTGLGGTYDFTLRWTRERLLASPQSAQSSDTSSTQPEAPALFTSLTEQLGLRLIPTKGPVEVVVIDHIEKPSEN